MKNTFSHLKSCVCVVMVHVSHAVCQIYVEKIISEFFNVKIWSFLWLENVFHFVMTLPSLRGNFFDHWKCLLNFFPIIQPTIDQLYRGKARSGEAGTCHSLSLTTANMTMFTALYQLWGPGQVGKLNDILSVFITSSCGVQITLCLTFHWVFNIPPTALFDCVMFINIFYSFNEKCSSCSKYYQTHCNVWKQTVFSHQCSSVVWDGDDWLNQF